MPRKLILVEKMLLRLPAGTLARISAVIGKDQDRASFIRAAVDAALEHAEAADEIAKLRAALALADRAFSTISTSNGAVREAQAAIRALNT